MMDNVPLEFTLKDSGPELLAALLLALVALLLVASLSRLVITTSLLSMFILRFREEQDRHILSKALKQPL